MLKYRKHFFRVYAVLADAVIFLPAKMQACNRCAVAECRHAPKRGFVLK